MSLATDSPVHSSSSDDFAAFLDGELVSTSDTSHGEEDADGDEGDISRMKRRKVDVSEDAKDARGSISHLYAEQSLESSVKEDVCPHPGFIRGLCIVCGEKEDYDASTQKYDTSVALKYIHKDLRLGNDEIARLRNTDLKNLFCHKKLYLVLDLDHTLLNSTQLVDIRQDEKYLKSQIDSLQDVSRGSLFRLDFMHMLTKLRPFVRTFLKEASDLFEMYIYTMGERSYAMEMAHLLDPGNVYFSSRVIAQDDCTHRHQKGLDVVLGQESAVVILDDTERVWTKHRDNLIVMERYNFFASSCEQFGFHCKSLSELKSDESESEGALASILKVLKQIHDMFFDLEPGASLADRDVRQVMRTIRQSVLSGCVVVFSRIFPAHLKADLWNMAEQMGAMCLRKVDPSVTHVVSSDIGTEKSRWAIQQKKFLVQPQWIEAANYFWQKQKEDKFSLRI